ncbi:AI-2E family transporter YdiK [Rubrivivax gelatinosus]|uniref:PurR-regulated permease PerM n=1 Tax=Rubrivivax gelatinosus TaxID=28068 RepID=A0ABS1DRG5_RUBGE|nr:AI-2E family transporter YdiK [Rubrivivax gelatinosus]MBK1712301.1 hypothetical protein [Rubrivivax gelatinosus]
MKTADITRTSFAVLFLAALIGGSLWILKPFIGPAIWSTMVVVATWPVMLRVQAWCGGRRSIAVVVMTLLLVLLFAVPLTLSIATLVENADRIVQSARDVAAWRPTRIAPDWVLTLPLVGGKLALAWEQAVAAGIEGLLAHVQPYAGGFTRWFVGEIGDFGSVTLQFLLTVVIAAVMYARGEVFGGYVRAFAGRLAGPRGEGAVKLAADAIRGVALGVGVTAVVQAVLGGIGLALAGVPLAGLLTALMFMLCIAQIGALPVLLPAAAWAFWGGEVGWGVFLLVWSLIVGTLDNFLRPVLIRLGADLPLLLIFAGVIGGLLGFGLVGIFVGPVVLAVAFTLLDSWIEEGGPAPEDPPPAP